MWTVSPGDYGYEVGIPVERERRDETIRRVLGGE